MSDSFPPDGDSPQEPPRKPRKLSDSEVDDAFSDIAAQYEQDSLIGPRDYIPPEDDGRFIPPEPGPIASADPFLTLGWSLLAGGLLLILGTLIFWPSAPRLFHIGCAVAVLIGGAVLTWRMPHRKDDDDDLGAVV